MKKDFSEKMAEKMSALTIAFGVDLKRTEQLMQMALGKIMIGGLLKTPPQKILDDMISEIKTPREGMVIGAIFSIVLLDIQNEESGVKEYPATDKYEVKKINDSNFLGEALCFDSRVDELGKMAGECIKNNTKASVILEEISKACVHPNELAFMSYSIGFLHGEKKKFNPFNL